MAAFRRDRHRQEGYWAGAILALAALLFNLLLPLASLAQTRLAADALWLCTAASGHAAPPGEAPHGGASHCFAGPCCPAPFGPAPPAAGAVAIHREAAAAPQASEPRPGIVAPNAGGVRARSPPATSSVSPRT